MYLNFYENNKKYDFDKDLESVGLALADIKKFKLLYAFPS
jgi:hypothetical protein